jgi:hypothetical protein
MSFPERGARLGRELRGLPLHRAPRTLLPKVMAATTAAQPAWRRAWWTWVLPARVGFMLAVGVAGILALRTGFHAVELAWTALVVARALVGGIWTAVSTIWRAGGLPLQILAMVALLSSTALGTGLAGLVLSAPRIRRSYGEAVL